MILRKGGAHIRGDVHKDVASIAHIVKNITLQKDIQENKLLGLKSKISGDLSSSL